ncbi:aminotransferase class I/II-fold pyridoxal phosphate-dependent enzyme [Aliikangiella sp. G2MR2-5]|uniref:aminotransferase class I/II-fold pyridoxal phosphate-dependent enzyme n=1 Tax=Aliikangiella sp. G2MR2-5 TaxID=2788943 RepID=UPI0018AA02AD|nr:aminotransferase class I/II-fold pyridoxal phosphate-dependent enzyme [Aliikangiella sp. G2MR2-5]
MNPESLDSKTLKLDFNERSDQVSVIAQESEYSDLWRYPQREQLEQQIADIYSLKPEQVFCSNGGDEAIMLLMRLIKETTKVILPLPAFSQYTWGVDSWQLDAILVSANSDLTINTSNTIQAIKQNPGAITIITRPNNPTGESIALETLLDIIENASVNQGIVFLDEAYIEFSDEEAVTIKLLSQFDNLVILRTLSKAYGLAGIRLGYILGSEILIEQFKTRSIPFNIPAPSIEIAKTALSQDNRQEVENYSEVIRKNRKKLLCWLNDKKIPVVESQANFVLLKLNNLQASAVKSFLAKNNLLIKTFPEGNSSIKQLGKCIRITIPYTLDRLLSLLEQALTPKLICLDMDGVLIDTSESYDQAVKATVEELSGQKISMEQIFSLRDQGGFNNDWVLSRALLETLNINVSLEKVTEVFQQFYLGDNNNGLVANEKPLIQKELIQTINKSQKTQFAVVTGRPRIEAQAGLSLIGLQTEALISLDDVTLPKPSPEGIKKLQCQFSNASWMCGDNPDDMQAAVASNSLAVGIGKRNVEALYQAGADIVLESINQLEDWLKPVK